jgi:CBS domain-containing protein
VIQQQNTQQENAMHAADIMTPDVITVGPETSLDQLVNLMLEQRISGVPVVEQDRVVGIVSEGDLLRRAETGTAKRRSHWLELLGGISAASAEYVRTHGRKVGEIMTPHVITVEADTPIAEIADILETRRIKRVPVVRGGKLVGIVSRANLLRALASRLQAVEAPQQPDDRALRDALLAEFRQHKWAAMVAQFDVTVQQGVVHLWGIVRGEDHRRAMIVAAENVPGVASVTDHFEDGTLLGLQTPVL